MSKHIIDTWNSLRSQIEPNSRNMVYVPTKEYMNELENILQQDPSHNVVTRESEERIYAEFQTFAALFQVWDEVQYGAAAVARGAYFTTDLYMMDPVGVSAEAKRSLTQLAKDCGVKFAVVEPGR